MYIVSYDSEVIELTSRVNLGAVVKQNFGNVKFWWIYHRPESLWRLKKVNQLANLNLQTLPSTVLIESKYWNKYVPVSSFS